MGHCFLTHSSPLTITTGCICNNSCDVITGYSELIPSVLSVCSCHGWSSDLGAGGHRSAPLARLNRTDRQPGPRGGQPGPGPPRYLRCRVQPPARPSSYHLETMFGLAPLSQVNSCLKCIIRLTGNFIIIASWVWHPDILGLNWKFSRRDINPWISTNYMFRVRTG